MEFELCRAVPGLTASRLIVLIPGANQHPDELRTGGFLNAVRDRNLDIDIALMAPQPAHLLDRSALAELHSRIVLPARAAGPVSVLLAGISWGGFLALLYVVDHPTDLDGICLLSPYLGNRMITTELLSFRSLGGWSAGMSDVRDELTEERRLWRYIAERRPDASPIRYLGFGKDDRFAASQRLLADQLPPQAVDVIPGGHDANVWRELWNRLLDRLSASTAGF
jgi:pimeloyl-ACP methyl ester carboxylesterase